MKSHFPSCLTHGFFFPRQVITWVLGDNPHQKPLFIDVSDCARRKLSAADNFTKLCEVGVDYTGVTGLGRLMVNLTNLIC